MPRSDESGQQNRNNGLNLNGDEKTEDNPRKTGLIIKTPTISTTTHYPKLPKPCSPAIDTFNYTPADEQVLLLATVASLSFQGQETSGQ